jgi:ABC-2 type transport system permease protein
LLSAFALLPVVFYNVVIALVARREELVLKRLRTGEVRDAEILAGTAAPAVALAASSGSAALPVLVLLAWVVAGVWATRALAPVRATALTNSVRG